MWHLPRTGIESKSPALADGFLTNGPPGKSAIDFFFFIISMACLFQMSYSWNYIVCSLFAAAAAAKSPQSCLTLCGPRDGSPPGSPVPGILQARTPEWVAICFSNAWKWEVKVKLLSHVWLLATPWTAAHLAPPSMGFFRQQYWSGLPLPSPMQSL